MLVEGTKNRSLIMLYYHQTSIHYLKLVLLHFGHGGKVSELSSNVTA